MAAIAEYLIACEVENKSPRTLQAYAETLRIFQRCVDRQGLAATVPDFAVQDAYRFLKAVADSGVAAGTRHRRSSWASSSPTSSSTGTGPGARRT